MRTTNRPRCAFCSSNSDKSYAYFVNDINLQFYSLETQLLGDIFNIICNFSNLIFSQIKNRIRPIDFLFHAGPHAFAGVHDGLLGHRSRSTIVYFEGRIMANRFVNLFEFWTFCLLSWFKMYV